MPVGEEESDSSTSLAPEIREAQVGVDSVLTGGGAGGARVSVEASLDGLLLGTFTMVSYGGVPSGLMGLSQHLPAGAHTLTLSLLVADVGVGVRITGVSVLVPEGPDADGNGLPDWIEARLARENSLDWEAKSSPVSPVCLEGAARFPSTVRLRSSASGEEALAASEGVHRHWYADVPLNPDGSPTTCDSLFEEGVLRRSLAIEWVATPVVTGGSIMIRSGDSLRLAVAGDGLRVTGPDDTEIPVGGGRIVIHRFDGPGEYQLHSTLAGIAAGEAPFTVRVLRADFGEPLFLYSGLARLWECPGVPKSLAVESDPRVEFSEVATGAGSARVFRALDRDRGLRHVLARLPESGAILARGDVRVALLAADSIDNFALPVIGTLSDGSQLIRLTLLAEDLPPGGYIEIRLRTAGITFLDGTDVLRLYAADFGADGVALVDILRPPGTRTSVCHSIRAYNADGTPVGQ